MSSFYPTGRLRRENLTLAEAVQICLDAIQVLGGYGYLREYNVERYLRDAKLIEIGEGTSEILRSLVARTLRN